jgi:hypothetical protein
MSARRTVGIGSGSLEGSWPTPDASVFQEGESPETWLRRREQLKLTANNGNGCGTPLAMSVQLWSAARGEFWTTPNKWDGERGAETRQTKKNRGAGGVNLFSQILWQTPNTMLGGSKSRGGNRKSELLLAGQMRLATARPSPAARDWKADEHCPAAQARNSPCLPAAVAIAGPPSPASSSTSGKRQGSLNPAWVQQLQGLPDGWTDLPVDVLLKLSATATRRKSPKR